MRMSKGPLRFRGVRPGIIWTEILVAIPIMGLLVALTASTYLSYYRARGDSVARQVAAWAAAGQLHRIQAGAPIDSVPPAGALPPDVVLKCNTASGKGVWEGFQLVTVIATIQINERQAVREQISGYVRAEVKP